MYIYAIGTTGNKQKIGHSGNPEQRLKKLQTGNPEQLHLHHIFEIDDDIAEKYEKFIHKEYGYKRLVGEWFSMSPSEVVDALTYQEIMLESNRWKL